MKLITEEWLDKAREDLDVASEIINVKELLEQSTEEGHENNKSNKGKD